jgi:Fe-S cluster assembly protein SufD
MFTHPRHWIIVRKNADVKILETFSKTDNGALLWINGVTEIFMEENAHADHHVLQNDIPDTRWTNYTQVSQHSNSLFNNYTFTLPGAQLVRNNLHVSLDQSATETHLYGLYLASENQVVDNHTFVDHRMPHCWSNELYKGVMTDKSKAVFNGKIYVHVDAQKTNAFQQNNNMLMSDKATVDTKPQLEIYADDVKCSHGSTIGQFNNEALFYLQARGINKKTARRMMVGAFAFDVVEKVKLEPLQHHIEKLIASNLEQWYE